MKNTIWEEKKLSTHYKYINVGEDAGLKGGFNVTIIETNNKYGGYPVDLAGAAFGDPAKVSWDFGDGKTAEGTLTPEHEFETTGTYTVCFTVSDAVTGQTNTVCQDITIEGNSIIEELSGMARLEVNPNPVSARSLITFELPMMTDYTISVYDVTGRIMEVLETNTREAGIYTLDIDAANYAQGVYLVEYKTPQFVKTAKITIVK